MVIDGRISLRSATAATRPKLVVVSTETFPNVGYSFFGHRTRDAIHLPDGGFLTPTGSELFRRAKEACHKRPGMLVTNCDCKRCQTLTQIAVTNSQTSANNRNITFIKPGFCKLNKKWYKFEQRRTSFFININQLNSIACTTQIIQLSSNQLVVKETSF